MTWPGAGSAVTVPPRPWPITWYEPACPRTPLTWVLVLRSVRTTVAVAVGTPGPATAWPAGRRVSRQPVPPATNRIARPAATGPVRRATRRREGRWDSSAMAEVSQRRLPDLLVQQGPSGAERPLYGRV